MMNSAVTVWGIGGRASGSGLALDSILDSSDFGCPFGEAFELSLDATDFSWAGSEPPDEDFSPHPMRSRQLSSRSSFFMIPES
tara:strand:+ start:368 stop:616 length:249 start_codon:yes stop_codon:yes gene_type:complete